MSVYGCVCNFGCLCVHVWLCCIWFFLFLSVMLVRLHFVQNKHVKCYILSHRPTRLNETALSRRLMSVVWIRPYSERVQTAADSVYTARRDATRQFCCVELSGVNCVLRRVHSGRTGLNRTAIQFSAVLPLWTTLYGYLQELSTTDLPVLSLTALTFAEYLRTYLFSRPV